MYQKDIFQAWEHGCYWFSKHVFVHSLFGPLTTLLRSKLIPCVCFLHYNAQTILGHFQFCCLCFLSFIYEHICCKYVNNKSLFFLLNYRLIAPSMSIFTVHSLTSLLVYRGRLGARETMSKPNSRHIFTQPFFFTLTSSFYCSPNVKFSYHFTNSSKNIILYEATVEEHFC